MAYKFNPFTDTLDIVGSSGGSYIDGEVEYHSNLPVTVGTPAVNSAFLVRKGEGLYFISRKPAGIWVRELNNGNLDDWKFAGLFSDLYRDANFRIVSDSDVSKELAFSLSGLTTGTTSTLTVPAASGTIARTEDFASPPAIGNTTANSGAFTTLAANNGTIAASAPVLDLAQTWDNAAVTFTGLKVNATDTASAAASLLADFQTGGTSRVHFTKAGGIVASGSISGSTILTSASSGSAGLTNSNSARSWDIRGGGGAGSGGIRFYGTGFGQQSLNFWASNSVYDFNTGASFNPDTGFQLVAAANVMELRKSTSAQTFRLYGTFTTSTNYQRMTVRSVKQTLSALSGASATTTGTLIPDGAVVVGVTTRVATAITGATGYQVGDGTDADRWGDINAFALNTTSDNRDWTAGTIECFTSGGEVTLTANGSNFTAGAIEICVFYLAGEAD